MGGPNGANDAASPNVAVSRRKLLLAGMVGLAGCNTFQSGSVRTDGGQETTDIGAQSGHGSVRYATPGRVATTLRAAGDTDGRSHVALYPETVYRPTETWEVPSGITLDYRGATVEPRTDADVHRIRPGGCIEQPQVDLRAVDGEYTSSVFRFDSEAYGFYGNNDPWHVRGGFTRGRVGEGTLFEFRQGGENAIYFVHVDHSVRNIGTVVDMHRGDAYGINGCRISGLWYGFERGIRMRNRNTPDRIVDNIAGNRFDVIAQPEESHILWDQKVGHFNVLRGQLWDTQDYSDVLWRIHAENAESRYGNVLRWFPVGGTREHLTGDVGPDVFDDRLGDHRNRVVVPWQLGSPVGAYDR